jgi:hypothetical protein
MSRLWQIARRAGGVALLELYRRVAINTCVNTHAIYGRHPNVACHPSNYRRLLPPIAYAPTLKRLTDVNSIHFRAPEKRLLRAL